MRGAVVEWLERLTMVRKVAGSSAARAKRLENSNFYTAANGYDLAPPFICRVQDTMELY